MFALQLSNVTKNFAERIAVNNVSLEIKRGEMFALVGPDGSGKTTTIRMLCGLMKPTSGDVNVLGFDVQKNPEEVKKRIGYLSQKFSLYGDLTIDENIEFFAEIHRVKNYQTRREELLEFTRLKPFRARLAEKLSGGMKQKLALACTLIHTPEIIFLDEPTTGVDPVSRRDFWKILSNLLKTGITILMTTPYLDEAERCSRVALMNEGNILLADSPQNIKKVMNGEIVEIVCSDIRKSFSLLKNISSVKEVQAFGDRLNVVVLQAQKDVPSVLSYLKQNAIEVSDWRTVTPSLENVFISLLTSKD
ncbi:MAG: ABC transporter ATP-binding protein [Ignavibacteriales bacterium]|nr:ABC transporter ATP-binding protein [Ignavibacteriales bacterium]